MIVLGSCNILHIYDTVKIYSVHHVLLDYSLPTLGRRWLIGRHWPRPLLPKRNPWNPGHINRG